MDKTIGFIVQPFFGYLATYTGVNIMHIIALMVLRKYTKIRIKNTGFVEKDVKISSEK
jgi:hypothetical protein